MGWRKILSHSIDGDIALGNWRARYNKYEKSLDIEYPSDGIPYIKTDTTFSGVLNEMEVVAGNLQICMYPGWNETIARDESTILDDAMAWDENASASQLIDYLFGSTAITMVYEGESSWISDAIDVSAVGKYHSAILEWVNDTLPLGSSIHVYAALRHNGVWDEYIEIPANGGALSALPVSGADLRNMQVRYKVIMIPSIDQLVSPAISQMKTTINSRKHFRVLSDGNYKESSHIVASISGPATETLT